MPPRPSDEVTEAADTLYSRRDLHVAVGGCDDRSSHLAAVMLYAPPSPIPRSRTVGELSLPAALIVAVWMVVDAWLVYGVMSWAGAPCHVAPATSRWPLPCRSSGL